MKLLLALLSVQELLVLSNAIFFHPWFLKLFKQQQNHTGIVHSVTTTTPRPWTAKPMEDIYSQKIIDSNISKTHLSPIDIDEKLTLSLIAPPLSFSSSHWDQKNFFLLNNTGKLAEFTQLPPMTSMILSGGPLPSTYKLDNLHAHWHHSSDTRGTEHSIDSNRFAMEFHAVYFNKDYHRIEDAKGKSDGLAVCSFIVESLPGDLYNREFEYLSAAATKVQEPLSVTVVKHNVLRPFRLMAKSEKYYHYVGTVTGDTTEPVMWIVFKHTIRVHPSQIENFRRLRSSKGGPMSNIRKIQTKYTRVVYSIDNTSSNSTNLDKINLIL